MPDDTISNAQYVPFLRKRRPDGSTEDYSLEEHLISNDPHGNIYIKRGEISDTKFTPALDVTNDETTVPASSVVYRVNEKVNTHINAITPDDAHGDLYAVKNHNHDNAYSKLNHDHDSTYSELSHEHDQYLERIKVENRGIYPNAYYELYNQTNKPDFNSYTTQGVYYVGGEFSNAPKGIASPDDYEGFLSVISARIGTNDITSSRVVFQMYTTKNTIWRRVGHSNANNVIEFSGWVVGAGDSAPIGSLLTMTGDEVPAGYLEANGSAVSCSNYKLLWEYALTNDVVVVPNLTTINIINYDVEDDYYSEGSETIAIVDDTQISLCDTRYLYFGSSNPIYTLNLIGNESDFNTAVDADSQIYQYDSNTSKYQLYTGETFIADSLYIPTVSSRYTPVTDAFVDTEIDDTCVDGYLLDDDGIPQIIKYVQVTDTNTIYEEGVHFRKNHGTSDYITPPIKSNGKMTFNNSYYFIYEKSSTPEYSYRLIKLTDANIKNYKYATTEKKYKYCTVDNFATLLDDSNYCIPNLNNRYLCATSSANDSRETLSGQEAGLPNIIGSFGGSKYGTIAGSFYGWRTGGARGSGSDGGALGVVYFDASRYSEVYGNSDTVTPRNIAVRIFIKASEGNLLPADASIGDIQAAVNAYLSNNIDKASTSKYGMVKLATAPDLMSSVSDNVVTASLLKNAGYVRHVVFDGGTSRTEPDGTVVINSQTLKSNRLHPVSVNPHVGGYYDIEVPGDVALKFGLDIHGNYATNNINIEYSLLSTGGYSSNYKGGTCTYKGNVDTLPSADIVVGDVYQHDTVDENNTAISVIKVWSGIEWDDIPCFVKVTVSEANEVQYLQLPVKGQEIGTPVYIATDTNVAGYPIGATVLNDKQVRFVIYTDTTEKYEDTDAYKLKMRIYWPDNWTGVAFDGTSGTFVGDIATYADNPIDWKLVIRLKY